MKSQKYSEEHDYWVRWEYSEEEWRQFERVDWGHALRNIILLAILWVLVIAGLAGSIAILVATGQTYGSSSTDVALQTTSLIAFIMIILLIVFTAFWSRSMLGAWKRHRARQTGLHRVTIGSLTIGDQAMWEAGLYVPLQELFTHLTSAKIISNSRVLVLRQKIYYSRNMYRVRIPILIPSGHEQEAERLAQRFRAETITFFKKKKDPAEPR